MKHIFLNLKRFDVPVSYGGVNRIAPLKEWGGYIVRSTQEALKKYDPFEVEFVQYFPEAHLLNAVDARCENSPVQVGCQGVYRMNTAVGGNFGAFTTNRPVSSMKAMDVNYTIIGHCEERGDKMGILAEAGITDTRAVNRILNQEIRLAVENGMKVLYCIGEKDTELENWDEVLREQMAQAAQQQLAQQQLAAQQSQQSWENQFAMDKYQSGLEQSTKDQMAAYGWSFLETGAMPSQDMLNAMGITEEDAQNYIYTLQSKANTKKYSSGGGGTSGTSGGLTLANAKAAAESGYFGDEVLNVLRKNGYSDGMLTAMYGYEPTSYGSETGGINSARFSAMARSLATQLEGGNTSAILSGLDEVWPDLSNTQRQTLQELLARYGYAYS